MTERKHLYRSSNALIAGVCAGIAEYFDVAPTLIRVIAVILMFALCGAPLLAYAMLAIIIPREPDEVDGYVDVSIDGLATSRRSRAAGRLPVDPRVEEAMRENAAAKRLPGSGQVPAASGRFARRSDGVDGQDAMPGAAYAAAYGTVSDAPEKPAVLPRWAVWLISFGIFVLVGIGAATMVGRMLNNVSWWNFWPFIIIYCGLIAAISPERRPWKVSYLFSGLAIACFGVVALLCTLDLIGWGVWGEIVSLWPWFIVAIGVAIVASALHSDPVDIGASLICICIIAFGCISYQSGQAAASQIIEEGGQITGGLPDGTPGKMLNMTGYPVAALSYDVSAADASISANDYDAIEVYGSQELIDNSRFSVSAGSRTTNIGVSSGLTGSGSTFGRTQMLLPMQTYFDSIDVQTTFCDLGMDVSSLAVGTIDVDADVTDANISLGEPFGSASSLTVNSRLSHIDITVPSGCEAAVQSDGNLNGTDLSGFSWDEGAQQWRTSGYADALNSGNPCWTIYIGGTMSNYSIRMV